MRFRNRAIASVTFMAAQVEIFSKEGCSYDGFNVIFDQVQTLFSRKITTPENETPELLTPALLFLRFLQDSGWS